MYLMLFYSVLFALVFKNFGEYQMPIKSDTNFSIISTVLLNIADEFILKEKLLFDVFAMNTSSSFILDVVNDFMKKSNGNFRLHFHVHNNFHAQHLTFIPIPTIILAESIDAFFLLEKFFVSFRFADQPIKYFLYIHNLTFSQLESSWTSKAYRRISVFSKSIFYFSYFVVNEQDKVILASSEWFSGNKCSEAHFKKLNVFHKNSMKWDSKLSNYEKFLNFYGCELVQMLPPVQNHGMVQNSGGYVYINEKGTNFTIHGITPIIFQLASNVYNFTAFFQPALIEPTLLFEFMSSNVNLIAINGSYKHPHVYFENCLLTFQSRLIRISKAFLNLKAYIIVTPGMLYTSFEKVLLPFDSTTWILLLTTFIITFLTIFLVKQLNTTIQNVIFGDKINNPFWNVISICFGISQVKLPKQNFSRFILLLFVFFCLIFRTCFQSKYFEFMTSVPRRAPPKTISDLIKRNYDVHTRFKNDLLREVEYQYEGR